MVADHRWQTRQQPEQGCRPEVAIDSVFQCDVTYIHRRAAVCVCARSTDKSGQCCGCMHYMMSSAATILQTELKKKKKGKHGLSCPLQCPSEKCLMKVRS